METTLNTLKNTYAQEQGYVDWDDLAGQSTDYIDQHWTEVCIRAQKAALEKAAESARVQMELQTDWYGVDRASITNENNLIR